MSEGETIEQRVLQQTTTYNSSYYYNVVNAKSVMGYWELWMYYIHGEFATKAYGI